MKRTLKRIGYKFLLLSLGVVGLALANVTAQTSASDIVLYASTAPVKVGNWSSVADTTAAGGAHIWNPDAGAAKLANALANPTNYFEMSFPAQAGVPYRLWVRSKADSNSPYNDSFFVQFSGSVTATGAATSRIGSTDSTVINLEDCSGCGLSGWGWQDNGWGVGVLGPVIYFQSTGTQTLRIQAREDGFSIDQIVLSPSTYLNNSPGALINDATIVPPTTNPPPAPAPTVISLAPNNGTTNGGTSVTLAGTGFVSGATVRFDGIAATNVNVVNSLAITATTPVHSAGTVNVSVTNPDNQSATLNNSFTFNAPSQTPDEIVLHARLAGVKAGNFAVVSDTTAAGGARMYNSDAGAAKLANPLANPSSYFEMSFPAQAGVPYRLWVRSKADSNSPYNDSFFVQFSGSVTATGAATSRIGSTSATTINQEECSGCGLSNWGWQDNGWGVNILGDLVYFQSTGIQTLRIQPREDGFSIDQIVLSPLNHLILSPGSLVNDNTILPSTVGGGPPPPPANQPPQVSISASTTSGTAPLNVSFVSNTSDPDGYINSYSWNFGDGGTSSQASPSHTYTTTGIFIAQLTVLDNAGASATTSVNITVNSPAPPPPTGAVSLRIVTFNASFGKGTDNMYDLNRQATYLAAQSPDVIGMCEVDQAGENMSQTLTNLMTQKTGVTWRYYWISKFPGCTEGNLIMTRWQLVSTSYRYLSYQRSVAQMTINVNGKLINFFATHLDDASSTNRNIEATELRNFMSGFAEPRFVVGDFNAGPDLSEVTQITSSYYDSWNEAMIAGTATAYPDNPVVWMTRTRRGRIDYVFYSRGQSNITITSAKIPDLRDMNRTPVILLGTPDDRGVRPSDHNMMVATFQLQ
jgi:endonuclease/exonuclease/phosphatase family metal-dependent hydrolase